MIRKILLCAGLCTLLSCVKQPEKATEANEPISDLEKQSAIQNERDDVANSLQVEAVSSVLQVPKRVVKEVVELKQGQSLAALLEEYQFTQKDSWLAEQAVKKWTSLTRLQAGQKIEIELKDDQVNIIRFESGFAELTQLTRDENQWRASRLPLTTKLDVKTVSTTIESSFYIAASNSAVPHDITNKAIIALSHLVDFQREIQPGDKLELVFQLATVVEENVILSRSSQALKLLNVSLLSANTQYQLYQFSDADGVAAFYHADGTLAQSFLMKTPLNGARLSSKFGKRHHPVLGYSRMHKGIDFGAPVGTPIMAAGGGKVVKAGWGGSFGNRIVIDHGKGYQTLYAHLNGFAKGIKSGARVKQGDIIGYLGNTGLSEARHLHYEVHKNGKAINPLTLKQPKNIKLVNEQLLAFQAQRDQIIGYLTKENEEQLADNHNQNSVGTAL
ncbi:M23 family metallopeptidase [Pseudoalteromonas sp. T1lg65]|uniref:M23 family metallopeptidase n=1 Tax=Pseudoalteromonas sp. T1lg65 TaxID=2077101 RepID=UPI003F7ADFEA